MVSENTDWRFAMPFTNLLEQSSPGLFVMVAISIICFMALIFAILALSYLTRNYIFASTDQTEVDVIRIPKDLIDATPDVEALSGLKTGDGVLVLERNDKKSMTRGVVAGTYGERIVVQVCDHRLLAPRSLLLLNSGAQTQ